MTDPDLAPYDALLLLSFGGPEGPDEVLPFLRRVTAGRGIPDERLVEVGAHYDLFGGRSPINDQCRALIAALRTELDGRGLDTPILWGNRNSEPFLADTLREAYEAGHRRILTLTTSAWSSYSSCRQYRENLADAVTTLIEQGTVADGGDLVIDKVRTYGVHPGFAVTNATLVTEAVRAAAAQYRPEEIRVLFVTHSIPEAMDETSGPGDGDGNTYSRQHATLAAACVAQFDAPVEGELVFCSRSGPPHQPWLEPDIVDRLEELPAEGVKAVIVAPIGFVSDHMEVIYDLDVEAAAACERLGLAMTRVPTVGTDPDFVRGLVDLMLERAAESRGEPVTRPVWPANATPMPSVCAPGCCPNLRRAAPALCGLD